MTPLISQSLIDRYSAGPSASKVSKVAQLQTTIRDVLGEDDYDTFLQGSYRNGTAIADINDVDIVARRKGTKSPLSSSQWEGVFSDVTARLRNSHRIGGRTSLGNKCVKLINSDMKADIVPAVAIGDFTTDPVGIWARRTRTSITNYPRTHYLNGVTKQRQSSDSFKPTVRLFKRWAHQYSDLAEIAPSFYIECAVHAAETGRFSTYLPLSFARVALEICSWSRYAVIYSVAGDKDILVPNEWEPSKFETFKSKLAPDARLVVQALEATTVSDANRLWTLAFGNR